MSRQDGTGNKVVMTGRDGIYFLLRRDGTVVIIFQDGNGRYIISSTTTGIDGTSFFLDGTGRYIFVFTTGRDGTLHIFFHCTEKRNAKHTDLGTKAPVLQVTSYNILRSITFRRIIKVSSYDIIRALSMGVNLYFVISINIDVKEG